MSVSASSDMISKKSETIDQGTDFPFKDGVTHLALIFASISFLSLDGQNRHTHTHTLATSEFTPHGR